MSGYSAIDDLSFKSAYNYEKSHTLNFQNINNNNSSSSSNRNNNSLHGRNKEYVISEDDYLLLQNIKRKQLSTRGKPRETNVPGNTNTSNNELEHDNVDQLRKQYIKERYQHYNKHDANKYIDNKENGKQTENEKPPALPQRSYKLTSNINTDSNNILSSKNYYRDTKYYTDDRYNFKNSVISLVDNTTDENAKTEKQDIIVDLIDLNDNDDNVAKNEKNTKYELPLVDRSTKPKDMPTMRVDRSTKPVNIVANKHDGVPITKIRKDKPIIPAKNSSINFIDSLNHKKMDDNNANRKDNATNIKTNESTNFIDSLNENKLTDNKLSKIPHSPSKQDLNINHNIDYLESLQNNDTVTNTLTTRNNDKNKKPLIPNKPNNLMKKDTFLSSMLKNSTSTKNLNSVLEDKNNTITSDKTKKNLPRVPLKPKDISINSTTQNKDEHKLELPKLKKVDSPIKDKSFKSFPSKITDDKEIFPKLKPTPPIKKDSLLSKFGKNDLAENDNDNLEMININNKLKKTVIPPKINRENKPVIKLNKINNVKKQIDEPLPEALLKRQNLNKFTETKDVKNKSDNKNLHLNNLENILMQKRNGPVVSRETMPIVATSSIKDSVVIESKDESKLEHKTKDRVRGPKRRVPKTLNNF